MHILVVDDNPDLAASLAELLKIDGYDDVAVAHDGRAALEAMIEKPPGLVICDLGLPGGMDGLDLALECRKLPSLRNVRLVAMSGYGDREYRNRALEAGFDELLVKPVKFDTLSELARRGPKVA